MKSDSLKHSTKHHGKKQPHTLETGVKILLHLANKKKRKNSSKAGKTPSK